MTPNARWTRFNADFTQESGNGRFQHSYGTWKLNAESNELTIENTNGLADLNEPFKVEINPDEMTWKRTEEGQDITVSLVRTAKLPETYGDQLLGLWKLEQATGNGGYFDPLANEETKDHLFFRWDKRFVLRSNKGRVNGVYNVHGHKPEVELIPYGDQFERSFWTIQFEEDQIMLTLLNTDEAVHRTFKRIHQFPE